MNPKRHFWLYAKKWYKRTNVVDDLRKLIADYSLYDGMSKHEIALFMSDIVDQNLMKEQFHYSLSSFSDRIAPSNCKFIGYVCKPEEWDYDVSVIYGCLSLMFSASRKQFGELGEPDPKLLPLSKNAELKRGSL